jgi:heterodisulfide reductase subunit C
MATCTPTPSLAAEIKAGCGENVYKCYQCKRCTAGCPVAAYAVMHPATIMRAVQLGQKDMIFDDKFLWLCTGCETCTTRCPQGIDVATIMDELKIMGRRAGRIPADAPYANLLRLNYDSIRRWGRLFEVELLMRDKASRPSTMFDDVGMGLKMMRKGKLGLFPARGGDRSGVERMVKAADAVRKLKEQRAAASTRSSSEAEEGSA